MAILNPAARLASSTVRGTVLMLPSSAVGGNASHALEDVEDLGQVQGCDRAFLFAEEPSHRRLCRASGDQRDQGVCV